MTPKTKNFSVSTDPKLRCTCGHPDCLFPVVTQETLDKLQLIREDLGAPMVINSGARCPLHPNERGRKDTDHQDCTAVDVRCHNKQLETKLKVLAGRHGATRVAGGAYCGFIHISWRKTSRRDVPTWTY